MNFPFYIAKKSSSGFKSGLGPILSISIASIAIGLIMMMLALAIVRGYQKEIKYRITGFNAHFYITHIGNDHRLEAQPISSEEAIYQDLKKDPKIRHIQRIAEKPGIFKTPQYVEGVVLKGVDQDYYWDFLSGFLTEGKLPSIGEKVSNEILISTYLSKRLNIDVGSEVRMYFVQNPIKQRKLKVVGLFDSGMEQFDKTYIIGDLRHIQRVNNWSKDKVTGFEVFIEPEDLVTMDCLREYYHAEDLQGVNQFRGFNWLSNELSVYNHSLFPDFTDGLTCGDQYIRYKLDFHLKTIRIDDEFIDIFSWLDLLDKNVTIILLISIVVACINMISTLLIIILDRTQFIGILKSLGASNRQIRWIFIYKGGLLIGKGLFFGNVIGLGLCYLQKYTSLITLNKETYYLDAVPIELSGWTILFLNLGTLIVCMLSLLLPSYFVTKISPIRSIRFN